MVQDQLYSWLPSQLQDVAISTTAIGVIGTILAVLLSTRIWSSIYSNTASTSTPTRPPTVPYSVPILRSWPSYLLAPVTFLEKSREVCAQGLYTVLLGPFRKTVIYSPNLIKRLVANGSAIESLSSRVQLLQHGWILPKRDVKATNQVFSEMLEKLDEVWAKEGPSIIESSITDLQRQIPNLITFMESPIDQELWERMSATSLLEDGETIETNFISLIQTYLAFFSTDHLLSTDLFEHQSTLVPLLLLLPSHLKNLIFRPSFFSSRSQSVLRTLFIHLQPFLDAMFGRESSVVYEDVEDLSTLLLQAMWTPSLKSAPQTIQSTLFLYLLSLTILPHNVVPWAILQYLSPWSLLNESKSGIEETINEKVKITQDKGFGAALPAPTVEIKVGTSSPISYSLANAIKKYGCGWDEYVVGKDITLADETNHGKWNISKGERVIAAHWMSPDFAPFKDTADENVVQEAFEQLGFFALPAISEYYAAIYPAFIASFLKLYEVTPIDDKDITLPPSKFAPGMALPAKDVRVRIRRRAMDQPKVIST